MELSTRTRDRTWRSQFWFTWQTRKPGPPEALKSSPHMHPLTCRRDPYSTSPPGLCSGMRFTCFLKKNKSNMLCRSWSAQCNFLLDPTPDCKRVKPLYVLLMLACGRGPWPAMLCKLRSPQESEGPRAGPIVIARSPQQLVAHQGNC